MAGESPRRMIMICEDGEQWAVGEDTTPSLCFQRHDISFAVAIVDPMQKETPRRVLNPSPAPGDVRRKVSDGR